MINVKQLFSDTNKILSAVLDAAPVGFILVDKDAKIKQFNKHSEILFGFTKDELLDKEIEVLLPGQFRENHIAIRDAFLDKPDTRMMGAGLDSRTSNF